MLAAGSREGLIWLGAERRRCWLPLKHHQNDMNIIKVGRRDPQIRRLAESQHVEKESNRADVW